MSIELDVDYITQPTTTTCWNASYKMMLRWTSMYESVADNLPNDKQMRERGILDSEIGLCRRRIGLKTAAYDQLSTPEGLEQVLNDQGPIWCAGIYCPDLSSKVGAAYKHVVVVRGVRTHWRGPAEVYVNDPYRGYVAQARPCWWSWSYFWVNLLKVADNCQYWG